MSEQSGKCADVGLTGAGGNLYQWVCADGVSNQVWRLRELQQDVYQIRNQRSGQCLNMLSNGGKLDIVQEPCSASTEQQWNFQVNSAENGWTGGYLRNEQWGKCLDDSQASVDVGADLGPWDCGKDKLNQMFRVRPYAL